MLLTISLREIAGESAVLLFYPEYDGFLWAPIILGLSSGFWGGDSCIFCTSSRALKEIVLWKLKNVKELGSVLEVPRFQRFFVPTDPLRVVETLGCLGNLVVFEKGTAMRNLY